MTEFKVKLSDHYTDRLYAVKKLQGYEDMTGNEYAQRLLESALYKLFPAIPEFDENGNLLNANKYRG